MDEGQRFAWNKLITGEFRVGVSQSLVVRAIAEVSGISTEVSLASPDGRLAAHARILARAASRPIRATPMSAAPIPSSWPIRWRATSRISATSASGRWSGNGTASARSSSAASGRTFLWSRGEELITDRFPELEALGALLPEGTVIDGEVLPWKDGAPLPFAQMQRRIGRKVLGHKILADVPVVLIGYDLLELDGEDVRERPLEWRRAQLEAHGAAPEAPGALADGRGSHLGRSLPAARSNRASARWKASC